jgi:hypothetical protein
MDMVAYLTKIKTGFERRHCEFTPNLLIIITVVNNFSNGMIGSKSNFN